LYWDYVKALLDGCLTQCCRGEYGRGIAAFWLALTPVFAFAFNVMCFLEDTNCSGWLIEIHSTRFIGKQRQHPATAIER
jgi:hypothetical protein